MYYANKVAGFILSPAGIALAVGLLALVCAKRKRPCAAKLFGWFAAAWLWLWMTPLMTLVFGVPLEREYLVDGRVPSVETFPKADAIVLLGGGMDSNTNLSEYAEMSKGADRVWQAARLWKAGKAPVVVPTGNAEMNGALPLLLDFGVPRESIKVEDAARNTEENVKFVAQMLPEAKKILLVTSAWHMRRSVLMFRKYAPTLEVVPAATDFEATMRVRRDLTLQDVLPWAECLADNSAYFKEFVGYWGYRLFR